MRRNTRSLVILTFSLALPMFCMAQSDAKNGEPIPASLTEAEQVPQFNDAMAEDDAIAPDAFSSLPGDEGASPYPILLAPTAFTPDGDGLNDKYFPRFLGLELVRCRFQVFDRWGRLLYTTTAPDDGWDGTMNRAGASMPQGVYVWLLEAQASGSEAEISVAGSVTLMR